MNVLDVHIRDHMIGNSLQQVVGSFFLCVLTIAVVVVF